MSDKTRDKGGEAVNQDDVKDRLLFSRDKPRLPNEGRNFSRASYALIVQSGEEILDLVSKQIKGAGAGSPAYRSGARSMKGGMRTGRLRSAHISETRGHVSSEASTGSFRRGFGLQHKGSHPGPSGSPQIHSKQARAAFADAARYLIEHGDDLLEQFSGPEAEALVDAIQKARATTPSLGRRAFKGLTMPPMSEPARAAAIAYGLAGEFQLRRDALEGSMDVTEAAVVLGIRAEDVKSALDEGGLVGLPDSETEGGWSLPPWQFDQSEATGLVDGLAAVLKELRHKKPLSRVGWLSTRKFELGGAAPINALRDGRQADVLRLARASSGT